MPKWPETWDCQQAETDKQTNKKAEGPESPTAPVGLLTRASPGDLARDRICLQSPAGLAQPPLGTWELLSERSLHQAASAQPSSSRSPPRGEGHLPHPVPWRKVAGNTDGPGNNFSAFRQQQRGRGLSHSPGDTRRMRPTSSARQRLLKLCHWSYNPQK